MKTFLTSLLTLLLLATVCKSVSADVKNIDKLRRFYRQHNMDFFGELIADEQNMLDDEKRHAKIELLADDARTHALAQLQALLVKTRGPMEGELLLRKATLLSDRARTATYFQNNPFKASKLKSPDSYLRQSIEVSQVIERRFPDHPKMDVVLFTIAYNFGELKEQDKAWRYYMRLVAKFAESPLVGDARLAIAEIQFDKRHFAESLAQLREIVKVDHPRLKNFALYKMAWTYYNMADLDSAMNSLERVIAGVNSASAVQRARLELRKEALHDLVSFYAERGEQAGAASAAEYFTRVGRTPDAIVTEYAQAREHRLAVFKAKNAPVPDEDSEAYQLSEPQELMFRLVQVYRDQGQHENSMVVADAILHALGKHPKGVALYRLRAESAEKLRRRENVVHELERFAAVLESDLPGVEEYTKGLPETTMGSLKETFDHEKSTPLVTAAPVKPLDAEHTLTPYQRQLSKIGFEAFNDFAGFLHGEWSKTQNAETARQALAVYDLGVRVFLAPWRGNSLEASFELRRRRAQLRFALKRWDAAAQDFRWLSTHMIAPNDAVVSNIQGEVGALESLLKEMPVKITAKAELHPLHQRLITAYDTFLAFYVLSPKMREPSANFVATSARLYKEYGRNDEALSRLIFYSRYFADQKDAIPATRDILALLAQGERWEELRDFSGKLISMAVYKTSAIAGEITHSHEYASLRLLESLEKNKDWDKAAKEFAVFAKENPDSSFVSQALIKSANAALENSKITKDVEGAVTRLEEATQAPDNAVRLQAWLGLESFYRKSFQWHRLRGLYEEALKLKPDAHTLTGLKTNLAALRQLDRAEFAAAGESLIAPDVELATFTAALAKFEVVAVEFRSIRFLKSNNNPARNFKRKADSQTEAATLADVIAAKAPKSLRAGAAVWANIVKAELLFEFADTLDGAALPAVLNSATEEDRKSYRETLTGQTRELRATAQKYAVDSSKLIAQVDYPFALDQRLNALLERCGERARLAHPSFAAHWAKRPGKPAESPETMTADSKNDADVRKISMKLLHTEDRDDARKLQMRLSETYLKSGDAGYAYAIASALRADDAKDEWATQAARQQFVIDIARLPAALRAAAETDKLTDSQRWNLGRWLAGRQAGLSDEEKTWLSDALVSLLRPVVTAAPNLQAKVEKN